MVKVGVAVAETGGESSTKDVKVTAGAIVAVVIQRAPLDLTLRRLDEIVPSAT